MRKLLLVLAATLSVFTFGTTPAAAERPSRSYRGPEVSKITTSTATVRFSCPVESYNVTVYAYAVQGDPYAYPGQSASGSVNPVCTGKPQSVVIPLATSYDAAPLATGPATVYSILDGVFCPSCGSYDTIRNEESLTIRK